MKVFQRNSSKAPETELFGFLKNISSEKVFHEVEKVVELQRPIPILMITIIYMIYYTLLLYIIYTISKAIDRICELMSS